MKIRTYFFSIIIGSILLISSCQNCGECWVTVDGVEELGTRTGEVCDADYDIKKQEREDVLNYMRTIYPTSEVEYVCQDN